MAAMTTVAAWLTAVAAATRLADMATAAGFAAVTATVVTAIVAAVTAAVMTTVATATVVTTIAATFLAGFDLFADTKQRRKGILPSSCRRWIRNVFSDSPFSFSIFAFAVALLLAPGVLKIVALVFQLVWAFTLASLSSVFARSAAFFIAFTFLRCLITSL